VAPWPAASVFTPSKQGLASQSATMLMYKTRGECLSKLPRLDVSTPWSSPACGWGSAPCHTRMVLGHSVGLSLAAPIC
jgi:hypothetical protein